MYVNNNNVTYFDSFGVEHIPKEIKSFINCPLSFVLRPPLRDALQNKNITTNIFRIQAYDAIMCGCSCIGFSDFMLAGKKMTDYTNLFFPHDFKENGNIIFTYFKNE